MGFENLNELNAMHLDVLREIGNIGSGNAATSLASMLNTTVDIEVPTISLVNYDHVSQYLGYRRSYAPCGPATVCIPHYQHLLSKRNQYFG